MDTNEFDRNAVILRIKAALKRRSTRTWSVTGGRGTAWGWIRVIAPPKRLNEFGGMAADDIAELSRLFGFPEAHHQGVSIPASTDYRREYVQRAEGVAVTEIAKPYWD